jgi:NTP pyrophosphatase (non-canonical NTP hydrolase)
MLQLSLLQLQHKVWVERNFPDETLEDAVLGLVEEVGEIAHHVLKMRQGIRGDEAMHKREILDGIADTVIFATHIVSKLGADYGELVQDTWDTVKQRNWVMYPGNGVSE